MDKIFDLRDPIDSLNSIDENQKSAPKWGINFY